MKLEVHFTIKGLLGSFLHVIEVDNMEADTILNTLVIAINEHMNHSHFRVSKYAISIFLIKELTY